MFEMSKGKMIAYAFSFSLFFSLSLLMMDFLDFVLEVIVERFIYLFFAVSVFGLVKWFRSGKKLKVKVNENRIYYVIQLKARIKKLIKIATENQDTFLTVVNASLLIFVFTRIISSNLFVVAFKNAIIISVFWLIWEGLKRFCKKYRGYEIPSIMTSFKLAFA